MARDSGERLPVHPRTLSPALRRKPGITRRAIADMEKVRKILQRLKTQVPSLAEHPEYYPTILNYARATLLSERLFARLAERELVDPEGNTPAAIETFRKMAGEQRALAQELGLTPRSARAYARGGGAFDLAAAIQEARNGEQIDDAEIADEADDDAASRPK